VFLFFSDHPERLSIRLVDLAKKEHSDDNISVIVVLLKPVSEITIPPPRQVSELFDMDTPEMEPFHNGTVNGSKIENFGANKLEVDDFGPETNVDDADSCWTKPDCQNFSDLKGVPRFSNDYGLDNPFSNNLHDIAEEKGVEDGKSEKESLNNNGLEKNGFHFENNRFTDEDLFRRDLPDVVNVKEKENGDVEPATMNVLDVELEKNFAEEKNDVEQKFAKELVRGFEQEMNAFEVDLEQSKRIAEEIGQNFSDQIQNSAEQFDLEQSKREEIGQNFSDQIQNSAEQIDLEQSKRVAEEVGQYFSEQIQNSAEQFVDVLGSAKDEFSKLGGDFCNFGQEEKKEPVFGLEFDQVKDITHDLEQKTSSALNSEQLVDFSSTLGEQTTNQEPSMYSSPFDITTGGIVFQTEDLEKQTTTAVSEQPAPSDDLNLDPFAKNLFGSESESVKNPFDEDCGNPFDRATPELSMEVVRKSPVESTKPFLSDGFGGDKVELETLKSLVAEESTHEVTLL